MPLAPALNRALRVAVFGGLMAHCVSATAGLPRESRVPGGVALVDVGASSEGRPTVTRDGAPVWVAHRDSRWLAVVGLPLSIKAGEQALQVTPAAGGAPRTDRFDVGDKRYPTQYVTIKDRAMVDPPADVMARIERESAHLKTVRSHWRESSTTDASFTVPAAGRLSGRFGGGRVLNGQPRSVHAGLDIAVGTGTLLKAPADAVVLDIGEYYFCGKAMFLDHGNGLISMYCHLSDWLATQGATVRQGQAIARSGATGRATGPHLHWSVYLNGVSVEPELFIAAPPPQEPRRRGAQ
ncbi:MAG: peptidoglycan DD-metalloendopeptidase family protein [Burkholderiales bacterium]|nr:peptidoglycan DD-metalloendopeptidase family protein [Burkholderiales bacterium]